MLKIFFSIWYIRSISSEKIDESNIFREYAVASEVPIASEVGCRILERGGNAVDASIATGLCVGVINAFSSGIGGGGFMLIKKKGDGGPGVMIDFRETAPRNLKLKDLQIDSKFSKIGGLAVGVPSEISGYHYASVNFGKLPWKDLFTESIELCKGFACTKELEKRIKKFEDLIRNDEGLRDIYVINGNLAKEGDNIKRTNLGKTLETLSKDPSAMYTGDLTESIIRCVSKNGGVMTKEDLRDYKIQIRDVLVSNFMDFKVYTTNLPSSGILVLKGLLILRGLLPFIIENKNYEQRNTQKNLLKSIHFFIETLKFVMSKRGMLGDPAFLRDYNEVVRKIIDETYINKIVDKIKLSSEKVLPFEEYGFHGESKPDSGTTHINVIDQDGLMVSLTSTVNLEFGAKFADKETGIIFNNQIDDFFIPGTDNSYEIKQTEENVVEPNKRPFSSAVPIIFEKEDELILLGAAGGIRIPTSILEVIFYLVLGRNLEEAIAMPRMHHQLVPNKLFVENNEKENVIQYLKKAGHKIEKSKTNSIFTSVQGILVKYNDKGGKIIHAVSDKRKGGKSFGK